MHPLLKELFTTDVGIMSSVVIGITLGMAAFYGWYFRSHMKHDALERSQAQRR